MHMLSLQRWCNYQGHQKARVSQLGSNLFNQWFRRLHTTVQTDTGAILTPGGENSSGPPGCRLGLAVAVETAVGCADATGCDDLLSQRLPRPVYPHGGVV